MAKIDMKKELKQLYQASAKNVVQVEIPTLNYIMVDGEGDPNTSPAYAQAVEALFSVAYTTKFMVKKGAQALDYAVMPLEGLWWADDMSAFSANDRSKWKWTMMIMQPPFVTDEGLATAISEVRKKKSLPALTVCASRHSLRAYARRYFMSDHLPKRAQQLCGSTHL